ncbi:MAG: flagellar motor protein MotB, partial [Synergistales bacterium]|nr:flagellar motor protein MotB [Synergistales bacterium]
MARQKKLPPPPPGAPLWLATYGDMVTLILTFFILLFSFSSIDVQKFEKMIQSFKGSLGIMPGGATVQRNSAAFGGLSGKDAGESKKSTTSVEEVAKNLKNYLKSQGLDKGVEVRIDQKGVTISFSE